MSESTANLSSLPHEIRPSLVLMSVVALYFAFNAATAWFFSNGGISDWVEVAFIGMLVFQPIAMGMWTALASGLTLLNATLAVPCLMALIVATGFDRNGYADIQRSEFIIFAVTGFVIFALAMLLFLAVRRRTQLRIEPHHGAFFPIAPGFHFGIRFLLTLTTLCAIVLAILVRLNFQTEPRPQTFLVFGPDFFIRIFAVAGTILSAAVLPTMAVPLFILYGRASKRALRNAIVFGALATLLVVGVCGALEDNLLDAFKGVLLVQLGATIAGTISGLALRWGGFRLVRRAPSPSP
jgi:hypothetical protein